MTVTKTGKSRTRPWNIRLVWMKCHITSMALAREKLWDYGIDHIFHWFYCLQRKPLFSSCALFIMNCVLNFSAKEWTNERTNERTNEWTVDWLIDWMHEWHGIHKELAHTICIGIIIATTYTMSPCLYDSQYLPVPRYTICSDYSRPTRTTHALRLQFAGFVC